MEQKHEEHEEPIGPKPGMWLPWLNLEDANPTIPMPDANTLTLEKLETPPIVPPLPSHLIEPPSYYAPTELNQRLARMARDTPRREAALIGLWACVMPLLSIALLVSLGNGWSPGVLGSGVLLAFLLHYNRLIDTLNQTRAALSLTGFGKEWIGGYIEAMFWPNSRIQGIASETLTHLLPLLTTEDASLLTLQQREILYTRLHAFGSKPEFRIAVLKALAVIGDEHTLPHVERLATTTAYTPKMARVRAAAREALTTLEERLAGQLKAAPPPSEALLESAIAPAAEIVSSAEQEFRSKQVDELLEKMKEESRSRRQPAMRLPFLIANWAVIVPYLAIQTIIHLPQAEWGSTLIWASLCLGSTQLYRLTLSSGQSETARKLAKTDDIRAVGPLAEALDWPFEDIQRPAREGLTRLLPQLKATDSKFLNPKQRHSLYKSLKMSNAQKEERLILAILDALEQVGDQEALLYVERLAHYNARLTSEKRIRDRAVQCLPYLASRAQANESSKMLLRASSATEMSPEILLRPATPAQGEAAEELLRPSVNDG